MKVVICHLKHSHLNWRAIPCRKRTDCVYAIFIFNTFWTCLSWFSLGLNRISQVHDMTIKFLFFFVSSRLVYVGQRHTIDGFPGWNTISHARIVLKWSFFFDPRLFIPFLSARKGYRLKGLFILFLSIRKGHGSKGIPMRWVIFRSTCPKASIKVVSKYHDLRTCVFGHWRGFWQAWNYSKSWCIPNYQISNPTKTHHFFAWFPKNSRKRF